MGILDKLFGRKIEKTDEVHKAKAKSISKTDDGNHSKEKPKYMGGLGFSLDLTQANELKISSLPIGVLTGSTANDFYVYEWFIKETGEIFYVGKGRGNRYKEFHEHAYEAEKIREIYETDTRFVVTGLTEEEAIELESREMTRILNETVDRLTNRVIPLFTKRDNGYDRSHSTPEIRFETAPVLFACEIEEHYFNVKHRAFDKVEYENLKAIAFISRST